MPFIVSIDDAQSQYPNYNFIKALPPSEQKAAFHVQDSDGNDLCLKIISPNYSMQRLQREIHALQSLHHPNVVGLKEYTFSSREAHTRHYLIEEFVPGYDLMELLLEGNVWNYQKTIPFFMQLFDGLEALRIANLVHRDLKPSNIRVKSNSIPVIIDFGVARHLDKTDITLTEQGAALGTPAYFAPEQFKGTKYDIDHRTDLFAAGIILYQALTGFHPFYRSGMNYNELSASICDSTDYLIFQPFTNLPRDFQLIVGRLLEKDRVRRPQSAAQVRMIFQKIEGKL
jgi:serine/threonine-protein kinase